jgi:hypothetical protein
MKKINLFLAVLAATFSFSGCAQSSKILGETLSKNGKIIGIKKAGIRTRTVDISDADSHQHEHNLYYRCSLKGKLIVISKKALELGYPYFTISYTKGSNKNPAAINSVDKIVHYCVPGYFDKDTDLLDDKCGHIGLGKSIATGAPGMVAYFHKTRNPFVPMWDAKRILEQEVHSYVRDCMSGDMETYRKAMEDYGKIETVEVD